MRRRWENECFQIYAFDSGDDISDGVLFRSRQNRSDLFIPVVVGGTALHPCRGHHGNYLLHKGEPGKTSAFLFLAPFFGVLTGWLLLGDPLYPSLLAGGLLIIIGIFLVNKDFNRKRVSAN